jgi:RNA polymerase sigma-70 factor (ECF subfamily)
MFSVCLSILKNRDDAQEATQDTFVKAFRALKSYNGESKFSSWLYKIAYRTSLDYIRKRKTTIDIVDEENKLTDNYNAGTNLENSELTNLLLKAINCLKPEEAGLIRMFYLEELSVKELEEITSLSTSNVKVKLFRARTKLSAIIKDQFSEIEEYLQF